MRWGKGSGGLAREGAESNISEHLLALGAARSHGVTAGGRSSRGTLAQQPVGEQPVPSPLLAPWSSPGSRVSSWTLNLNGCCGTVSEGHGHAGQLVALTRFCEQKTREEQPVPVGAFISAIFAAFQRAALCGCERCGRARAASWRLYNPPPQRCGVWAASEPALRPRRNPLGITLGSIPVAPGLNNSEDGDCTAALAACAGVPPLSQ